MTREEFKEEIIRQCIEDNKIFCEFQDKVIDILKVTHEILTKAGITYYGMFGTMIGACRDGGIIPWDKDVDVIISINDALKAQEIFEKNLPGDMYIISNFNDDSFPYYQMRIGKKGYDNELHVDVFYYGGLPDGEENIQKVKKEAIRLFLLKEKKHYIPEKSTEKYIMLHEQYLVVRNKLQTLGTSNKAYDRKINELLNRYPIKEGGKIMVFDADGDIIDVDNLGKPQQVNSFETEFMGPEHPEDILSKLYGNYMEYMPFERRYDEYKHGLRTIKNTNAKAADSRTGR